jgi:hypothetical protein
MRKYLLPEAATFPFLRLRSYTNDVTTALNNRTLEYPTQFGLAPGRITGDVGTVSRFSRQRLSSKARGPSVKDLECLVHETGDLLGEVVGGA